MTKFLILAFPLFIQFTQLNSRNECYKIFRVKTELNTTDSSFNHEKKYMEISSYPDLELVPDSVEIVIYNLAGKPVFHSTSILNKWNYKTDLPAGTYFSQIRYKLDSSSGWTLFQEQLTLVKVDCAD